MTIQTVRLYMKPGCHLCEQVEDLLEVLADECPMHVEQVDITTDIDIFDRYRYEIPVVAVEGGGTASGRISESDLRRILRLGSPRPVVRHSPLPPVTPEQEPEPQNG